MSYSAPTSPGGDAGDTGTRRFRCQAGLVDIVICFPVLLLVIWLAVAFAVWGLAAHAAQLAVAEAGIAARADGAIPNAGQLEAAKVLAAIGSPVTNPVVQVTQGPNGSLSLSITGQAPSVFPGLSLGVSATSTGPIQQVRSS